MLKQVTLVNEAEKYQKERDFILANNKELHNTVEHLEHEYKKENNHLHKIIDKFYETVEKFMVWICHKFGIGESKELIKTFEEETRTFIDPQKQLEHEEREKEWDLEL